jgi:hypothetical protein
VVVCLIIYGSIDTLTGGYLYDRQLMKHFERNGHSMHLVSLPMRRYPLGLADNLTRRLKERLQRVKPNLVLQDELCHPSLIALNRGLKTDRSMPIVSIVHHLYCKEKRRRSSTSSQPGSKSAISIRWTVLSSTLGPRVIRFSISAGPFAPT